MKTLEASKAAANFSRVLNAVHSLHESFEIVRKGVPCAYLVTPVERYELAKDAIQSAPSPQGSGRGNGGQEHRSLEYDPQARSPARRARWLCRRLLTIPEVCITS